MDFSKIFKYWFPVFLWMCFIYLMSTALFSAQNTSLILGPILRFLFHSISHREIEMVHSVIRKLAHLTEYFISGLLLFRAFRAGSTKRHAWRWALSSLVILVALAASDEYHQTYVTTRTPSVVDVGIDTMGGVLALSFSAVQANRRKTASAN
jgi:VanZ family protein